MLPCTGVPRNPYLGKGLLGPKSKVVLANVVGPTWRYSDRPPFFRIFKNVFSSSCCGTTQINIESPPSSPISIATPVEEAKEV